VRKTETKITLHLLTETENNTAIIPHKVSVGWVIRPKLSSPKWPKLCRVDR